MNNRDFLQKQITEAACKAWCQWMKNKGASDEEISKELTSFVLLYVERARAIPWPDEIIYRGSRDGED